MAQEEWPCLCRTSPHTSLTEGGGKKIFIIFLRSSGIGAFDICQHSYFLTYVLGLPSPPNLAADKGNIVHKALELLARQKVAWQDHYPTFSDPETGAKFDAATFTSEEALAYSWEHYVKVRQGIQKFAPADRRDCLEWMNNVLTHNGGQFDPRQRVVLAPEHYFHIEFPQDWAHYDYSLPDGTRLVGQLAIKGTVDLLTVLDDHTIEYVDYKTGSRKDWVTGEEKTAKKLRKDPQLLLYHYAIKKDFPQYSNVIMTIFFARDGGPFSFAFGEEDMVLAEQMIRKRFNEVRAIDRPRLLLDTGDKPWWCKSVCHFGKTLQEGTGSTICQHIRREVMDLGMDRVFARHGDANKLGQYGTGGGRSGRNEQG